MKKAGLLLRCVVIVAIAPACTTWRPVTVPPPVAGEEVRYRHLRVDERRAGTVELRHARVTADSVVGVAEQGRVAIGTDRVRLLEQPRFSWGRTLAAIGLVGAVVLVQLADMVDAAISRS